MFNKSKSYETPSCEFITIREEKVVCQSVGISLESVNDNTDAIEWEN